MKRWGSAFLVGSITLGLTFNPLYSAGAIAVVYMVHDYYE